jgi:hypothetical protein
MSNLVADRFTSTVRRFLLSLPDSEGNSLDDRPSIERIAIDYNADVEAMRDFRDGRTAALDKSFVVLFGTMLGNPDTPMLGVRTAGDDLSFADPSNGGWYGALLSEELQRTARMRHFHVIDTTRPEVRSALECWADLAVTGNLGDSARYAGGYEAVVFDGTQVAKNVIKETSDIVNFRIMPDDVKWLIVRGMAKYGVQWGELGFSEQAKGKYTINTMEPRHARTMFVHRDLEDGSYDWRKAYKQILPGRSPTTPTAFFPEYKIVPFQNTCNWGDLYGESILNPCLRSYIQVESMEAGMIIRRLERASMRYKHFVDVGLIGGGAQAIKNELDAYERKHTKTKTVDATHNMRMQKITLPVGQDVYLPVRDKDSPADILPLEGDQSIGEIADFLHFFNKFLAGLGPPKAHLGYESDTMRSVITDLHIVFARKVRRMQLKFLAGMNKIYWIQMILQGIDPRRVRYQIFPPALGTRDELIRAQVLLLHATTCRYLSQAFAPTGEQPSKTWMLQTIMGYDEETLVDMKMDKIIQEPAGSGKNGPAASAGDRKESEAWAIMAQTSPEVLEQTDHLKWLLEERALSLHLPSALKRLPSMQQPFGTHFEDIVRGLGIKELHDPTKSTAAVAEVAAVAA